MKGKKIKIQPIESGTNAEDGTEITSISSIEGKITTNKLWKL